MTSPVVLSLIWKMSIVLNKFGGKTGQNQKLMSLTNLQYNFRSLGKTIFCVHFSLSMFLSCHIFLLCDLRSTRSIPTFHIIYAPICCHTCRLLQFFYKLSVLLVSKIAPKMWCIFKFHLLFFLSFIYVLILKFELSRAILRVYF